ncbi:MAG: hypothetical protein COA77_09840 [Thaumarchaeota archaeon]|nr:MAG: hypothetical protein COA77_09840 [Nitrososphaerota archaeon]
MKIDLLMLFCKHTILFSILIIVGVVIIVNSSLTIPIDSKSDTIEIEESSNKSFIKIGTVGSDTVKLSKRFLPTAEYIAHNLSNDDIQFIGKVIIAQNVDEVNKLLNQELDLYFESPLTAFYVSQESNSEIFLTLWKENIPNYHSVFFVNHNSTISSLDGLVNKTIVFQGPESTSGYHLPLYHLITNGFSVDGTSSKNINYVFSNDDENTLFWVITNRYEVGVSSNQDFFEISSQLQSQLKIIDNTAELPRQVVSHRSEMSPEMAYDIKNILLNMHNNPEGQEILEKFKHTAKYSEIKEPQALFDKMTNMLTVLGLN